MAMQAAALLALVACASASKIFYDRTVDLDDGAMASPTNDLMPYAEQRALDGSLLLHPSFLEVLDLNSKQRQFSATHRSGGLAGAAPDVSEIRDQVWQARNSSREGGSHGYKSSAAPGPISFIQASSEISIGRRTHYNMHSSSPAFKPEDIEDCVACMYVWQNVEMKVGDAHMEEDIYFAFRETCLEAEKTAIFYPACEDMMDSLYGMIGDYMDNIRVLDMCTKAKLCRSGSDGQPAEPTPPTSS